MARTEQDPKSTFTMESRTEDGSLLHLTSNRDTSPSQDHKCTRRARRLLSPGALGESFLDLLAAIACAYFIVFAALVYSRRDEPLNRSGNEELLDAAKYVSVAFAIRRFYYARLAIYLSVPSCSRVKHAFSTLARQMLAPVHDIMFGIPCPCLIIWYRLL
jgi:hypothetical protein